MEIVGNTYEERCNSQLKLWVEGQPIHNKVDDECCPDFSCCRPNLLQPEEARKKFAEQNQIGQEEMLVSFLSLMIDDAIPENEIHIIK